jgi:polyhydroxyalkanoate synthesis regulator protein
LTKILNDNRIEFHFDDDQNFNFNFDEHHMSDLKEQMQRMQEQLNQMMEGSRFRGDTTAPKR